MIKYSYAIKAILANWFGSFQQRRWTRCPRI